MIFGTNSNYMLKYQKAKAKLVEYDISQKDFPILSYISFLDMQRAL